MERFAGLEPSPVHERDALVIKPELAAEYGLPLETHTVNSDGYQLTLHRIPASGAKSQVALLLHGVTGSSADWLLLGRNTSLGPLLADSGYDVWMMNERGNTYSRSHSSLSAADNKFWDFSFHEAGTRDLPVVIDHVLEATGEQQLLLVAHSTGATSALAMCTSLPAACSKVRGIVSMAAVVSSRPSSRALLRPLGSCLTSFKFGARKSRVYEVPKTRCKSRTPQSLLICRNFMLAVAGYRPNNLDRNVAAAFLNYSPSGTSIKAVEHILQNMQAGRFQQFDYGAAQNMRQYGSRSPPVYNLTAVTTKVALVCSQGDTLSTLKDCDRLYASLPNAKKKLEVDKSGFRHFDYVMSRSARSLVYESVVSLLRDLSSFFNFSSDNGVVVVSFAPLEDNSD